ncbi:hypothetical protein PF003_g34588 [Phytophthora fragariae]|nr:hypothetical protein PF003_g34588 [Phytophthora fragariae]
MPELLRLSERATSGDPERLCHSGRMGLDVAAAFGNSQTAPCFTCLEESGE